MLLIGFDLGDECRHGHLRWAARILCFSRAALARIAPAQVNATEPGRSIKSPLSLCVAGVFPEFKDSFSSDVVFRLIKYEAEGWVLR